MMGEPRMKSKRRRALGIGLLATVTLLVSLFVAPQVIGKAKRTIIHDRFGDGGALNPGSKPGFCDVVKATSKLARNGRVRHTVTTGGPLTLNLNAPPVVIKRHRVESTIGLADFILFPGEPGVRAHLKNHRRTVVYYVKRSVIADAVGNHKRYFWVVDQCNIHDDRAPDRGSPSQPLKHHHRHHHHRHHHR
jgi:hypothetical protein